MTDTERREEAFDAQVAELMKPDEPGKKKKKVHKKWSRKRKILTAAGAAVILFAAFRACTGGGGIVAVATTPLTKGDVTEVLSLTGPISGTDSVDVFSNLHSEVQALYVKEGDQVEQGQVLAELNTADAQREVDIAKNAYDLAVAEFEEQATAAVNGYAKAVQDYNTAKGNYDRSAVLAQAGSISPVDLETARNAMEDAAREVSSYRVENGQPLPAKSYELRIKDAQYELETKQEALEDTKIISPITGTVVRVNTKVGRFADETGDTAEPLFVIENLDTLELEIDVSEYSIGKVALGQEAVISADILNGDTVTGEVTAISPTGEEKSGGSSERVIPTTIRINDKDSRLIAGITARAELTLNEVHDTWVVPGSAVMDREDGSYIAAVKEGAVELIPVDRGVESDIQTEVKARGEIPLEEGLEIITSPDAGLTDGMAVTAVPGA